MRGAALLLMLALAGCASDPGGGMFGRPGGDRYGPPVRPYAQPTHVIAAEIALARAARDAGQWTALAERASTGAQIAWNGSTTPAAGWLATRANPATPDRWEAREAWASCDGSAVVIAGIGHDSAGQWSRFTRVWERDRDTFRWTVTVWQPDAELTTIRQAEAQQRAADAADDAIVVEAMNMVRARVAPCPPTGGPALRNNTGDGPAQAGLSRDGTLRWTAAPDAATGFVAWWQADGEWRQVHAQSLSDGG